MQGVGGAMGARMVAGKVGRKKKQPAQQQAVQQPKKSSPIVAWVVLIVIWFLTIYPMATKMIPGVVGLVAAVIGLFILKAVLMNKLREILP